MMMLTTEPIDALLHAAPLGPAPAPADLQALFADPAAAGRRACDARNLGFARHLWIRAAPPIDPAARAVVLRDGLAVDLSHPPGPGAPVPPDLPLGPGPDHPADPDAPTSPPPGDPGFPEPTALRPGDRLILRVDHDQLPAYCAWLTRAAAEAPAGWSLAPHCPRPGGLFRLHLIAAARLALPLTVRVEARHDLLGIRLAQVALGFGPDTLAGPIDAGRHLPLAGVPRPSETSEAALQELVRQAGLDPTTEESRP